MLKLKPLYLGQDKKDYIVYHDSCLDGFLSGMIAYYKALFYGVKDAVILPMNYSDNRDALVDAKSITLVDFSFPMSVLSDFAQSGVDVTVVDHHKAFIEEFLQYNENAQFLQKPLGDNKPIDDPLFAASSDNSHYMRYHPVTMKPLFTTMEFAQGGGKEPSVLEFFLNNNEVPDKNSDFVHSGASLSFQVTTTGGGASESFKAFMLDETNGQLPEMVRLGRYHDLWLHKGNEMSESYAFSHWFKKFHKENRAVIEQMKKEPKNSFALFGELIKKFNSVLLAEKLVEAWEELKTLNEKLEILASSDAVKEVLLHGEYHPEGAKICYVDGEEAKRLGISIVGSYLVRKKNWDVCIMDAVVDDEKHIYSLRSNEEGKNVDVSTICAGYYKDGLALSGGGHKNAAGVSFAKDKKDLFFEVL